MSFIRSAVLYTALALGANAALADTTDLQALREGTLKKLVFLETHKDVSQQEFFDPAGNTYTLADWQGKYVLLNFWATWCAPCRKEMPDLQELQAEFGGERFEVVPVATGRNALAGIDRFFDEIGITELPVLLDPKQKLARDMAVLGLPISVIINPEGQEIARLRGDAEWASDSAKSIISALITEPADDS